MPMTRAALRKHWEPGAASTTSFASQGYGRAVSLKVMSNRLPRRRML